MAETIKAWEVGGEMKGTITKMKLRVYVDQGAGQGHEP